MLSFVLLLTTFLTSAPQDRPAQCDTWQECRTQALQAAQQHDYERFHDLAWRAVQKGKRNDPELMQMLARAQSLSGRPGDALVMLQRLADLGVNTDAATSEDFTRVRALPGWTELAARIGGLPATTAGATPGSTSVPPASTPAVSTGDAKSTTPPAGSGSNAAPPSGQGGRRGGAAPGADASATAANPAVAPSAETSAAAVSGDAAEAIRFTTMAFTPAGLAYDRVSSRFIVGDHDARKL